MVVRQVSLISLELIRSFSRSWILALFGNRNDHQPKDAVVCRHSMSIKDVAPTAPTFLLVPFFQNKVRHTFRHTWHIPLSERQPARAFLTPSSVRAQDDHQFIPSHEASPVQAQGIKQASFNYNTRTLKPVRLQLEVIVTMTLSTIAIYRKLKFPSTSSLVLML